MTKYRIDDFSEIDFVNIDPEVDVFVLKGRETYKFSPHMCHYCWSGGTVLERTGEEKKYHCVLCENELSWHKFVNDFLEPKGDVLEFLLPEEWDIKMLENWFEEYKGRRREEEKIREDILRFGKE